MTTVKLLNTLHTGVLNSNTVCSVRLNLTVNTQISALNLLDLRPQILTACLTRALTELPETVKGPRRLLSPQNRPSGTPMDIPNFAVADLTDTIIGFASRTTTWTAPDGRPCVQEVNAQ